MKLSEKEKPKQKSAIMTIALFCVLIISSGYCGILIGLYILPFFIENISSDITPPPSSFIASTTPQKPSRLIIPNIGVNAAVESVGVNKNGNMKVPSTYHTVAWYNKGAVPGLLGASVIVGHLDNGLGLAAVFSRLKELTRGNEIYIQDVSGNTHVFSVTHIAHYPYNDAPLKEIFIGTGTTTELRLITCSGDWVPRERNYTERLVVYAVLKSDSMSH